MIPDHARAAANAVADLIYDVGMHNGDDTAYYLAKGFRVLAFEAHPDLAKAGRARFAHALDQGQLEIVEGAIVPVDHAGDDVTFFANSTRSEWGTISADLAHSSDRRPDGTTTTTVPAVSFVNVLQQHGVPHHLKIDIEAADRFCLDALAQVGVRPTTLSIEAELSDIDEQEAQLDQLAALGYRAFLPVQQARLHKLALPQPQAEGRTVTHRFARGSSGPFGRDLQGPWLGLDAAKTFYVRVHAANERYAWHYKVGYKPARSLIRRACEHVAGVPLFGWYDTHARLTPPDQAA